MKLTILGAGLLCFAAQPALAQSSTSTDANAQNSVNVTAIVGPQTLTQVPQNQRITYDGHSYSTPSVQGSYFGGTNPCLVGTGGGAAGGPIGFNINIGRSDEGCSRRSDAAAWHAMGFDNIAVARMCQDEKNADAFFAASGLACPGTGANGRYRLASGERAPTAVLVPTRAGQALMASPPPEPPAPPPPPPPTPLPPH